MRNLSSWDDVPKKVMSDVRKTCECGRTFTEGESSGTYCFRCKLDGIRFNWVGGGGYGRKAFHDRTHADVIREQVEGSKRAGTKISKVSTRAELV